jgi:hypothetical protein
MISLLQVTEDNKHDYVRLVCQMKMTGAIREELFISMTTFSSVSVGGSGPFFPDPISEK